MASYYKRLKTDLTAAAAAGLITPQQSASLYENIYSKRLFASFKAAHWISLMAGLMIAAGISLVIASNWDKIGAAAKILTFLAVFAAVAETAVRFKNKPCISLPAGTLWFFMPIIGIGLYAQIFNLSGDPVKPYLVWLALVLPLAFLSTLKVHAILTALLSFAVLYYGNFSPSNMLSLVSYGNSAAELPLIRWCWPPLLIFLAFAVYLRKIKTGGLTRLTGLTLGWLLLSFLNPTALHINSPVFIMLAFISLAVIWLVLSQDEENGSRLPALIWTAVVYAMTFYWHYPAREIAYSDAIAGVTAVLLVLVAAVILAVARPFKSFGDGWRETAAKAGLLASMFMVFFLFDAGTTSAKIIAVAANLLLILTGLALIINGAGNLNEKRINSGVSLIFLIIVTRFVDIFGSLLNSGLAFITSGCAFAGLAYLVNRGRKALIEAAKKP